MKIETERLLLRELTLDDFDALYEILSDTETMQHYPKPFDEERTKGWIEWNLRNYKEYGFGLWAVILKETGEFSAKDNRITGSGESYYYNGEAWSAISTSKKYEQLQSSIKALAAKNGLSPIEWEGPAWIDVAKKRSNK